MASISNRLRRKCRRNIDGARKEKRKSARTARPLVASAAGREIGSDALPAGAEGENRQTSVYPRTSREKSGERLRDTRDRSIGGRSGNPTESVMRDGGQPRRSAKTRPRRDFRRQGATRAATMETLRILVRLISANRESAENLGNPRGRIPPRFAVLRLYQTDTSGGVLAIAGA